MKAALAVLLVLAAACAVSAAQPTLFNEWLSAQKSGKARPAYYGSEAETVHACLRTIDFDNCNTFDACGECTATLGYFETKLGCCHPHGYGYDEHPQETFKAADHANIGSCWWNVNYFDAFPDQRALPSTGSVVVGTFDVTCELKDEAEKCSEIFCDDMVLKGWGQIHEAYKVAIEGQPTAQGTDDCALLSHPLGGSKKAAKKAPAAKAPVASKDNKAGVQNSEYYHSDVQYFQGTATVYSGYVDTYSCSHNLKVKEGHFQAVLSYALDDADSPIVPSPGQFILRPYTIDLKLKKAGEY